MAGSQREFDSEIVPMAEAAAAIESDDRIFAAGLSAAPTEFLIELCKRREELSNVLLYTAILTYPFDFLKAEFRGHITNHSFFYGPLEKQAHGLGNIVASSYHLSESREAIRNVHKPNVLAIHVSPPDADGFMSMGPCGGVGCFAALEIAERVIVSVNESLPYVPGERNRIHVSQATHITRTDSALAAPAAAEPTPVEKQIAAQILPFVHDGDTLQIGIGGIPNALAYGLDSKKDLGIHTEMLTDSLVHLAKTGVVTGRRKNHYPGRIVFSFASGSQELLDFTNENDDLVVLPVEEVVSATESARNDNFCSINTCVMVDLTGQVASESVGLTQISGTGGQLDLIRGARLSKGGRSFIALKAAREAKSGLASNIRLTLPPGTAVTTPRADAQYIVTEYGVADMRQRSLEERALRLIEIAHPDFQGELRAEAQSAGLVRT